MKTKTGNLIISVILAVITGTMPCCKSSGHASGDDTTVRTPVTVTSVVVKPMTSTIELPAVSRYLSHNIVRAITSGIIDEMGIREGDFVKDGQYLFSLRTKEAAALGNSTTIDSLLKFSGSIKIVSHKSGYISSISLHKGDFVQEGDPVASISDLSSLVFILNIPFEFEAAAEKLNDCELIFPDQTRITGKVTGKLPEMDIVSQTVAYIVKPVTKLKIPANLIAKAYIIRSSVSEAQVVPKEAVLSNETQTEFWVMKLINDSTAVRIKIIKGLSGENETEIIDPKFSTTDRIVLDGNYGLPDTASVSISRDN